MSDFAWPGQPAGSLQPEATAPKGHRLRLDMVVGGLLMLVGTGLHVAAMFPDYSANPGHSILASGDETAIYICLEAGWLIAGTLVLLGLTVRGGAAMGAGLGLVELGFLVTDTASGLQVSDDRSPGLWLAWAGLGAAMAGACLAASCVRMGALPRATAPLPPRASLARAFATVPVAIVAVAAFWPSWDDYHLVSTSGQAVNITLGNAFSQPRPVAAGEVVAGVAIGVVAILAAFWTPPVVGAWATAGVVVALASQLISGAVQVSEPVTTTLGRVSGLDVPASSLRLTSYWGLDVAAAVVLAALAIWAGLEGRNAERHERGQAQAPDHTPFS